jgi:hypothetical protein
MPIDTERNRLLIEAYLSGQISEAAWQEHLREEPGLRDQLAARQVTEFPLSTLLAFCKDCPSPPRCDKAGYCARQAHAALMEREASLLRGGDDRDLLAAQGRWPSWRALIEDLVIVALILIGGCTVVAFVLWALGIPQWMGLL